MTEEIGGIVMASGQSRRYGRDKLLEKSGDREILLRACDSLTGAGLRPLVVTRSEAVRALAVREGIDCVVHSGSKKSDTMRAGLEALPPGLAGFLFMPGDQPLTRPASIQRMMEWFLRHPDRAVRLGYGGEAGSPVLFPAACRAALLAYTGDRGGREVLSTGGIPCDIVAAGAAWELWDVDTPEQMARVKAQYELEGRMP